MQELFDIIEFRQKDIDSISKAIKTELNLQETLQSCQLDERYRQNMEKKLLINLINCNLYDKSPAQQKNFFMQFQSLAKKLLRCFNKSFEYFRQNSGLIEDLNYIFYQFFQNSQDQEFLKIIEKNIQCIGSQKESKVVWIYLQKLILLQKEELKKVTIKACAYLQKKKSQKYYISEIQSTPKGHQIKNFSCNQISLQKKFESKKEKKLSVDSAFRRATFKNNLVLEKDSKQMFEHSREQSSSHDIKDPYQTIQKGSQILNTNFLASKKLNMEEYRKTLLPEMNIDFVFIKDMGRQLVCGVNHLLKQMLAKNALVAKSQRKYLEAFRLVKGKKPLIKSHSSSSLQITNSNNLNTSGNIFTQQSYLNKLKFKIRYINSEKNIEKKGFPKQNPLLEFKHYRPNQITLSSMIQYPFNSLNKEQKIKNSTSSKKDILL